MPVVILYLYITTQAQTVIPASIVIKITPEEYVIGERASRDLASLIVEVYENRESLEEPNIILSAGNEIRYERVIEALEILKRSGFENVGLANEK
jgi:biopolymer transport protein ExbD